MNEASHKATLVLNMAKAVEEASQRTRKDVQAISTGSGRAFVNLLTELMEPQDEGNCSTFPQEEDEQDVEKSEGHEDRGDNSEDEGAKELPQETDSKTSQEVALEGTDSSGPGPTSVRSEEKERKSADENAKKQTDDQNYQETMPESLGSNGVIIDNIDDVTQQQETTTRSQHDGQMIEDKGEENDNHVDSVDVETRDVPTLPEQEISGEADSSFQQTEEKAGQMAQEAVGHSIGEETKDEDVGESKLDERVQAQLKFLEDHIDKVPELLLQLCAKSLSTFRANTDLRYQKLELRRMELDRMYKDLETKYRRLELDKESLKNQLSVSLGRRQRSGLVSILQRRDSYAQHEFDILTAARDKVIKENEDLKKVLMGKSCATCGGAMYTPRQEIIQYQSISEASRDAEEETDSEDDQEESGKATQEQQAKEESERKKYEYNMALLGLHASAGTNVKPQPGKGGREQGDGDLLFGNRFGGTATQAANPQSLKDTRKQDLASYLMSDSFNESVDNMSMEQISERARSHRQTLIDGARRSRRAQKNTASQIRMNESENQKGTLSTTSERNINRHESSGAKGGDKAPIGNSNDLSEKSTRSLSRRFFKIFDASERSLKKKNSRIKIDNISEPSATRSRRGSLLGNSSDKSKKAGRKSSKKGTGVIDNGSLGAGSSGLSRSSRKGMPQRTTSMPSAAEVMISEYSERSKKLAAKNKGKIPRSSSSHVVENSERSKTSVQSDGVLDRPSGRKKKFEIGASERSSRSRGSLSSMDGTSERSRTSIRRMVAESSALRLKQDMMMERHGVPLENTDNWRKPRKSPNAVKIGTKAPIPRVQQPTTVKNNDAVGRKTVNGAPAARNGHPAYTDTRQDMDGDLLFGRRRTVSKPIPEEKEFSSHSFHQPTTENGKPITLSLPTPAHQRDDDEEEEDDIELDPDGWI